MNITELINKAKLKGYCKSDLALTRKLKSSKTAVDAWKKGVCLPRPPQIVKLCKLAKVDPAPWLLWADTQRYDGETKIVFEGLLADYQKRGPEQLAG